MASSSTIPKDSPPSDGAQKTEHRFKRSILSSSVTLPSHSIRPSPRTESRNCSMPAPSDATHSRTSAGSDAIAATRTSSPLRGSYLPQKKRAGVGSLSAPSRRKRDVSIPLYITAYSPPR
jgi:hypothetical protein